MALYTVTLEAVFEFDDDDCDGLTEETAEAWAREAAYDDPRSLDATVTVAETDIRFVCAAHGTVDAVECGGYSLGHCTDYYTEPDEQDLEGITFTFTCTDAGIDVESDAGSYMDKFGDWEPMLIRALQNEEPDVIHHAGHADCHDPCLVLGPDEEPPEWWDDDV